MVSSRSIPEEKWTVARKTLIFYFAQHGIHNAEDLAHDTLELLLRRDDFTFEKEEDFPKVCYGFARRVLQSGLRAQRKHAGSELNPDHPAPNGASLRLNPTEMSIYLNEVIATAKSGLSDSDWQIIETTAVKDDSTAPAIDSADANRKRVRLHRARSRLSRLIGWEK